MSSTYFYHLRSLQTHGTALLGMISDILSGAKGTTQSSAIIWLSLNPSLSLSGTSWHHPIANSWYLCFTSGNQSCWITFHPFFTPSVLEPKAQHSFLFKLSYIIDIYLLLLLLLLFLLILLCRIVTCSALCYIAILCSIVIYCVVILCINCIAIL